MRKNRTFDVIQPCRLILWGCFTRTKLNLTEENEKRENVVKKHFLLVLVLIIAVFGMTGCSNSKYSSHYYTIAHGTSTDSDSASVFFGEFEGTEVFKLKIERGKTAKLQYSGKLKTGSATVYYDCGEAKTELFSIHSGDEINAYSNELAAGTVYIIIETNEKCESGSFDFEIIYYD